MLTNFFLAMSVHKKTFSLVLFLDKKILGNILFYNKRNFKEPSMQRWQCPIQNGIFKTIARSSIYVDINVYAFLN